MKLGKQRPGERVWEGKEAKDFAVERSNFE